MLNFIMKSGQLLAEFFRHFTEIGDYSGKTVDFQGKQGYKEIRQ